MIEQIKQALEKATQGKWDFAANLIANAPEWLRYLIGEVERLQYERGLLKLTLHTEIQKENKELQKALEGYADEDNWKARARCGNCGHHLDTDTPEDAAEMDCGALARQALSRR